MKDSLFGFKDNEEREEFIIVIPVLLFFAWLGYYLIGNTATEPDNSDTRVVAVGADIDGDGVADANDHCTITAGTAGTAGTAANFGCPSKVTTTPLDTDGDGIDNSHDHCPNTRGVVAYNGCAEGDVKDTNTLQANTAVTDSTGTDLTLVDTDEDGVNDLTDQCPTLAGSADNGGCPADSDGDTIADAEDRCPSLSGIAANLGCPADDDKDGIYNSDDECPAAAGDAGNRGCPPADKDAEAPADKDAETPADTDADGIIDSEDQCPDLPGTSNNGCPPYNAPDSDGDNVVDAADLCPEQPGTAEFNGCPPIQLPIQRQTEETDSDADGVVDSADLCPTRAGETRFQGCPADVDADGVSDADDRCPDAPGPIDNNGCPALTDSDGDGVADVDDQCPSIAGVADSGCPVDSDGDGVADADDQCNGEVGTIALRGCAPAAEAEPAMSRITVADQRILDEAVAQVAFNSSSAVLTPRSREILREIASLMKKYPDAFLEISGHTDSTGSARRNMDLSMQRAKASASFIASEGITLDRLFAYGYGESQPVTENNTLQGRRLNRRVEFNLKFP